MKCRPYTKARKGKPFAASSHFRGFVALPRSRTTRLARPNGIETCSHARLQMCLRERFSLNGYIILLYLHLSSSRYLTSQAGSFSHVLLKCSFTFGSSDLFGRYSKCAWDSDLSAQDCYTTYLNYYGTVSSRLYLKQPAKRTKPFSTPKPLFCFGSVGPRPQFFAIEKTLGLLLSPNCHPIKRPCNMSLRRSQ